MKRIVAIMLILAMAFAFAGCNKDDDPTLEPEYVTGSDGQKTSTVDLSEFEGKLFEPYAEILASGNYWTQFDLEDRIVTYFSIDGNEQVVCTFTDEESSTLDTENDIYFSKIDGAYYLSDGQGYYKITSDFETTYAEYAEDVDYLKAVMASSKALVDLWITSLTVKEGNDTAVEDFYYEQYYVQTKKTTYTFLFDTSKTLVGYTKMKDGDESYITCNYTIGNDYSSNQIVGILQLKDYASSSTSTTTAE